MKTKFLKVFCLLLVISMLVVPVNAAESAEPEFQLQGIEVTLYGDAKTVAIPFVTPVSYGIEGQFSTTATGDANTIKLTGINTAFAPVANEDLVDVTTGTVMWVNNDFNGPKEDELVTGVYTIPADTAEGEYTVSFELRVFTGEDYEPIEPNETYTATIKVKKHVCSDVTTDNDHLCDDVNCPNRENASEHEYAAVVTDPTCTDKGYTTYTCNCGHTYTDNELPAKDHAWGEPAGYTNNGDGTHTAHYVCGNDSQHKKDGEPTEHDFTNGDCICGEKKPVTDIAVVYKGAALANAFTVEGNVVTVTYSVACKVGYWDATAGKYVALTATKVSDNCYSFTAPEGVTEVLLVVKGDVNGNGSVNVLDKNTLGKSILPKNNENYRELAEAWQIFAADVNGNGSVNVLDKNTLGKSILPKNNENYKALTW